MPRLFLVLMLLSVWSNVVAFPLSPTNCTYLQTTVPRPKLKYMLGGQLHVIWSEKKAVASNYSAQICCTELQSQLNADCSDVCPRFKAMTACTSVENGSKRQCSMQVSQNLEYTVYLSGTHEECKLRSDKVKIRPRLSIAYPGPVRNFSVYSQPDSVIIEWTKTFQYVQLLYSLRCTQLASGNGQKSNTGSKSKMFKRLHSCCIRVRLPSYRRTSYYSEVCKTSQNKVPTSRFQCGSTHECKRAEVDNLSDFAGQLLPDDSNWPYVPPAMVIQIQKRKKSN